MTKKDEWGTKKDDFGGGRAQKRRESPKSFANRLSCNIGKQPLLLVRSKLPQGNFRGSKFCSVAMNVALNTLQSSQTHLPTLKTLTPLSGNSTLVNSANSEGPQNANTSQQRLFHRNIQSTYQQKVPHFDPAVPKETSPFNNTPRVAAFIAAGTTNLLM